MITKKNLFITFSILLSTSVLQASDGSGSTAKNYKSNCYCNKNKCQGATGPRGPVGHPGPRGPRGHAGEGSGAGWELKGNADTDSGTAGSSSVGINFIGTTDAENLEVRLNNSTSTFFRFTQAGVLEFINPNSNTFLGLSAGLGNTAGQNVAIGNSFFQAIIAAAAILQ